MNFHRFLCVTLLLALLACFVAACSSGSSPTPSVYQAPGGSGRCGDGECDEKEQANPALCPQDCTPVEKQPGACTAMDWLLVVNGCSDWHGNAEPSANICSSFKVCVTMDEQCNIQGSDQGQYDQSTCAFTSPGGCMSYEVSCPDFPISVSGELASNMMQIRLDASQVFEQMTTTEICVTGKQVYSGPSSTMQTGYGSAIRNGGGYFCKIEARDGAHVDVTGADSSAGGNLSYSFSVDLKAGCNGQ
jgi:hypothetical protein